MQIALTEWQYDFVMCDGPRYLTAMVGRGGGKTNAIMARATRLCTTYPKFQYMYISPVGDLGETCFEEMTNNSYFMKHVRKATNRKYPQIDFKNKSCMKFRSMQRPRGLRGKNIHEVALDEIQDLVYTKAHFQNIIDPLVRGASPIGNFGTVCMAGQFGNPWVKEQFYDFGSPVNDDGSKNERYQPHMWRSWRIPASKGWIYEQGDGPADYQRRKEQLISAGEKAVWDQEYECIPTANQCAAFPTVQIDDVSKNTPIQIGSERTPRRNAIEENPRSGVPYVAVVDLGCQPDPTGIIIGDNRGNVVYEEEYPVGQLHEVSARKACALAAKFNRAILVIDSTGGAQPGKPDPDAFVKYYRQFADDFGLGGFYPIYFGGNSGREKQRMVNNFTLYLQSKRIAIPVKCVKTLTQLKAYEYRRNANKKLMEYGGPRGTHDEFVSCMLMYVEALQRDWAHLHRGGTLGSLGA